MSEWSAPTARIELSSVCVTGARIDTWVVRMPRIILPEFNTHRVFSRNAASSRAIPVDKLIQQVIDDPFVPLHWGANEKGMVASQENGSSVMVSTTESHPTLEGAWVVGREFPISNERAWLIARDNAVRLAQAFAKAGYHKQIVNRLIEPWMWTTVVATACNLTGFWRQRLDPSAEPHMRMTAEAMKAAYDAAKPQELYPGEWHLPFTSDITDDTRVWLPSDRIKVSVARAASVSYKTVDGFVMSLDRATALHDDLIAKGHPSPLEHVASADRKVFMRDAERWQEPHLHGNLWGWRQYRQMVGI